VSLTNGLTQKCAYGDGELVAGDESTTDLARSNLRHVEDDRRGDDAHTETGDETTDNEEGNSGRHDLEDDTDAEDQAGADDGRATADHVRERASEEGAEEGTSREDGRDERLLRSRDVETGRVNTLVHSVTEVLLEVAHAEHTADVPGVETIENATKRGEDAGL
jgi:hypothetical protein